MFLNYYGLREQPFAIIPDNRFLYLGAAHQEALAALMYNIQCDLGLSALIAGPGLGKTTLLGSLVERFRLVARTAFVFETQCNSRDLIRHVLCKLGSDPGDTDINSLFRDFSGLLAREGRTGRRVLIIVDEAHNLGPSVLETVRLLSNFQTTKNKRLHIILAGQPRLAHKLSLPDMAQLQQRIMTVARLRHFSELETSDYVNHRLAIAGYSGPPLFATEAIAIIDRKSGGIPREINRICFGALTLGCALEKKCIDAEVVREVAADLDLSSTSADTGAGNIPQTPPRIKAASAPTDLGHRTVDRVAAVGPAPAPLSVPSEPRTKSGVGSFRGERRTAPTQPVHNLLNLPRHAPVNARLHASSKWSAASSRAPAAVASPAKCGNALPASADNPRARKIRRTAAAAFLLLAAAVAVTSTLPWRAPPAIGEDAVASQPKPANSIRVENPFQNPVDSTPPVSANPSHQSALSDHSSRQRAERSTSSAGLLPSVDTQIPEGHVEILPVATAPIIKKEEDVAPPQVQAPPLAAKMPILLPDPSPPEKAPSADLPSAPQPIVPARIVKRVEPVYPEVARAGHMQGTVLLVARIDKHGRVRDVQTIKGNALLANAAKEAVRQWVYTPFLLNRVPVETDTTVTVKFRLSQ